MSELSVLKELTDPDEAVRAEGVQKLGELTAVGRAKVMAALVNRRTGRTPDLVTEMEAVTLLSLDDFVKYSDYIVSKLRHNSNEVRHAAMEAIVALSQKLKMERRAISFMYITSLDTLVSFTPSAGDNVELTLHRQMMSELLELANMVLMAEARQAARQAAREAIVAKAKIAALGAAKEAANAAVGTAAATEKRAAAREAYEEAVRAKDAAKDASARATEVWRAESGKAGAQTAVESDYLVSMLRHTDLREGALRALLEIQKVRGSLDFRFTKSIDALDAFESQNEEERKVYSQLRAALDMPRRRQALHFVKKARLAPPR